MAPTPSARSSSGTPRSTRSTPEIKPAKPAKQLPKFDLNDKITELNGKLTKARDAQVEREAAEQEATGSEE
eukprot:12880503-Alexandrium_andersonii.AAC.1